MIWLPAGASSVESPLSPQQEKAGMHAAEIPAKKWMNHGPRFFPLMMSGPFPHYKKFLSLPRM